jgi:sterol 3beta-glucosyltransferase
MRIAVLCYGTRGDIQPFLSLGDELVRRGHSVVLTANKNLAGWAARSGLPIIASEPDMEAWFKRPSTQRAAARGQTLSILRSIVAAQREAWMDMMRACSEACAGADLVVSSVLSVYLAMSLVESSRAVHVTACTMPLHPTRSWTNLSWPVRDFGVAQLNRLTHAVGIELGWLLARSDVQDARSLLGLAPLARRPRWEELPSVHLYSPSLCERPSDWDAKHEIVGACSLSSAQRLRLGEDALPAALESWLDAGDPPLFFGFSSMPIPDPASLVRDIAVVTRQRGLRALIVAGWSDYQALPSWPAHVFVAPVLDYDAVLSRCCAAVHHGGSGTTWATLRAGLPTLITSMIADQPFWGWRVQQLGVGETMPFSQLTRRRLARALDTLLAEPTRHRARELATRLSAEHGAARAADALERAARKAGVALPERGSDARAIVS